MIEAIPGLETITRGIDLSFWGGWLAGQVGYVVGFVLNWLIILGLLWKFAIEKYILYRYDVEIVTKRGETELIKHDRGRVIKLKDGTEGFKLRKHKTLMDPLDFKYVQPIAKRITLGIVRVYQNSPRSFNYLKEEVTKDRTFKGLRVVEADKNRAIEMAVNSEAKVNPTNPLLQYAIPLIGMGAVVTIVVLIFLMADKWIEAGQVVATASKSLQTAVEGLNACQVASGGVLT